MRTNSSGIAGIYKDRNRYFVTTTMQRYAGARTRRHYFHTLEEAIIFKRQAEVSR
jgi:hypothetical protein